MNDRPSAPKIRRSGRYYACPYCSFSADKRVSLNRHMRVHVGLPLLATHPVSPPPAPAVESPRSVASDAGTASKLSDDGRSSACDAAPDRFCVDCKIQFSSLKTYQVHKQHYCQSRKPVPPGSPGPAIEKPVPLESQRAPHSPASNGSNAGQMTILVLPTQPPIVIPFNILQSARLLTAEQPIPHQAVIVSPLGEIQFRSESPEETKPAPAAAPPGPSASFAPAPILAATTPIAPVRAQTSPQPTAAASTVTPALSSNTPVPAPATPEARAAPETALDLSARASDQEAPSSDTPSKEVAGSIRIREELAHVNPSHGDVQHQQPALPFLPPKVFAELEALGMCLGVPSGHDMTSNPAQWLAMLENAVLQASLNPAASAALLSPANKPDALGQTPRPGSAIPCEECNITFRRMESYLVHKQYYCAARHQPPQPPALQTPVKETVTSPAAEPAVEDAPATVQRPSKMACPQCGIEFESAVVLQAHRTFYCPKRDADPAKVAQDGRKVSAEPALPATSGPSPNNNGDSFRRALSERFK